MTGAKTGNRRSAPGVAQGGAAGSKRWRIGVLLLLLVWACAMLLSGSILLAGHWLALPLPGTADPILRQALAQLDDRGKGRWQLVHVLYSDCRCSQRTFDYLASRATPAGVTERLLFVGRDDQRTSEARARGLLVQELTPEELKRRFNIETVPLLIVLDPTGDLRYVGGYTRRKQGLDYQDLEILSNLSQSRASDTLPAYGCAVSRELQSYLDPIGVKYRR